MTNRVLPERPSFLPVAVKIAFSAAHAMEVRALRSKGLSLPVIAAKTGLSYGSVHRLVSTPK